jgi:hypothetical protein
MRVSGLHGVDDRHWVRAEISIGEDELVEPDPLNAFGVGLKGEDPVVHRLGDAQLWACAPPGGCSRRDDR